MLKKLCNQSTNNKLECTQSAQTSAKATISQEILIHEGRNTWGTVVGGRCRKQILLGDSLSRVYIVSWFDLETYSKVIDDGAIVQNTCDFLLVLYSNFGY